VGKQPATSYHTTSALCPYLELLHRRQGVNAVVGVVRVQQLVGHLRQAGRQAGKWEAQSVRVQQLVWTAAVEAGRQAGGWAGEQA